MGSEALKEEIVEILEDKGGRGKKKRGKTKDGKERKNDRKQSQGKNKPKLKTK